MFGSELKPERRRMIRQNYEKWDRRWLDLADHVSQWSKDRSTKVGCVIVGEANQVLSLGYNGFPRGVNDTAPERHQRPTKYQWTEHAERNAIYNAARTGTNITGAVLYVPWFPCIDCARGIVQSGIDAVVTTVPESYEDAFLSRWANDFRISYEILTESRVGIAYVERD